MTSYSRSWPEKEVVLIAKPRKFSTLFGDEAFDTVSRSTAMACVVAGKCLILSTIHSHSYSEGRHMVGITHGWANKAA